MQPLAAGRVEVPGHYPPGTPSNGAAEPLTENKPALASNSGMDYPANDDAALVDSYALKMMDRHGNAARQQCLDCAEIADRLDDTQTAATWREIAEAVGRLRS